MGLEFGVVVPFPKPSERIRLSSEASGTEQRKIRVLYNDDYITVIDKPAGVITGRYFGITEIVREMTGCEDIAPVHRLDTDTTGVLVFGKSRQARGNIQQDQFAARTVRKMYLALVEGQWRNTSGIIAPILVVPKEASRVTLDGGAKYAVTTFRQIGTYQDAYRNQYSLLSIGLRTGRTHQIRAHLSFLGFPIAGDRVYGSNHTDNFPRQMLHASRLTLNHPIDQRPMTFHAPYPTDFPPGITPISY